MIGRYIDLIKYALILIILIPAGAHSFRLRQLESIPLEGGAKVYGQASGNIVIASKSGLKFFDCRWKPRFELAPDSAVRSVVAESGLYYGIEGQIPSLNGRAPVNIINIYNARQLPLWSAYDLASGEYYLSPDGNFLVVASGAEGLNDYELLIYHIDRQVIKVSIGSFVGLTISSDSKFILVDCGSRGVRLLNSDGKILGKYDYQKKYAFSEDGRLAGFYVNGRITIIEPGKNERRLDFQKTLLNDMVIRDDLGRLALAFSDEFIMADLKDGRVLWKYPPNIKLGKYVSADISPNGKFAAGGVDVSRGSDVDIAERHVQGFIHVYDIGGQTVEKFEVGYSGYGQGMPEVVFSPDNRTIVVQTKDSLHVIGIY
nr:hypothetical protein [candidate division Zixibacteria bacterium]